jgi:hypothetical protein
MGGFFGLFSWKKKATSGDGGKAPRSSAGEPSRRAVATDPYHSVTISAPRGRACRAAQECAGKRFLATEAPALPLAGCDAAGCTCRYVHHDDRRAEGRRASDGITGIYRNWYDEERRGSSGRRDDDC